MTPYTPPLVSIAILDYARPREAERLLTSLREHVLCPCEVVYVSNGGDDTYVQPWYESGLLTRWVRSRINTGCGLGTRLAYQACMAEWVLYVQVDQYLCEPLTEAFVQRMIDALNANPHALYVDLAGDQGHGRFSERASFMNRARYLAIPGLSETIGGPGPYADHRWTEQHVQEHMAANRLTFLLANSGRPPFIDNGKWSRRTYPDGAETIHATDTKVLRILRPFTARLDGFPNLTLTDEEWREVLEGRWPVEGKIPEHDKPHSFVAWPDTP